MATSGKEFNAGILRSRDASELGVARLAADRFFRVDESNHEIGAKRNEFENLLCDQVTHKVAANINMTRERESVVYWYSI
jgi:hypothetical protein